MPRRTKVTILMEELQWLTIQELTVQNSATVMWKMIYHSRPLKIAEKLDIDRQTMKIRITEPRLIFTEHNFNLRASRDWNLMPDRIRMNDKLTSFKRQVKSWIIERRDKEPDASQD